MGQSGSKFAQRRHLLGLTQLFVLLEAFGDVHESDHAPDHLSVVLHRVRPVFSRKVCSVGVEHDLIGYVSPFAFLECLIYAAFLDRIRVSVGSGMMDHIVHVFAQNIGIAFKLQKFETERIGEGAVSIHIRPVNAFADGVQQQRAQVLGVGSDDRSTCMIMLFEVVGGLV